MNYKDIVKDWITDLIGLAIWVVAIILAFCKEIEWWPDFVIAMIIGGIFFLIPDEVITGYLKKFIKKKLGDEKTS